MPRLTLSLPTELGPDRTAPSDGVFRIDTRSDHSSIARSRDDGDGQRPTIERWLSCWVDGARRR